MTQYAVIAILDEPAAAYTMTTLPLHLTFLGIFSSLEAPAFFSAKIEAVAGATPPLTTTARDRAMFGVGKDIPVTTVEKTPAIAALHETLLAAVDGHAEFRAAQFTGEGFGPHVTDQGGRCIEPDTVINIEALSLVEVVGDDVFVRAMHPLTCATD